MFISSELICPECGSKKHAINCLTSYPAQYEYECNVCGFSLKYYDRKNSYANISQNELELHKIKLLK